MSHGLPKDQVKQGAILGAIFRSGDFFCPELALVPKAAFEIRTRYAPNPTRKRGIIMKIVFVHGHLFNVQTWSQACERLEADGTELHLFSQMPMGAKAVDFLGAHEVNIFIGYLFHDLPGYDDILEGAKKAGHRLGLGMDAPQGFSTFTPQQKSTFESYLKDVSVHNSRPGTH